MRKLVLRRPTTYQTIYGGHEVFEAQTDGVSGDFCDGETSSGGPFPWCASCGPYNGGTGACGKYAPAAASERWVSTRFRAAAAHSNTSACLRTSTSSMAPASRSPRRHRPRDGPAATARTAVISIGHAREAISTSATRAATASPKVATDSVARRTRLAQTISASKRRPAGAAEAAKGRTDISIGHAAVGTSTSASGRRRSSSRARAVAR